MALPEDRRDDLELFLGAAAGDGAALPDPQTRVERYLAHIADPTVDKPDHPETRIELFLDAIEGGGPSPQPVLPDDYQRVEYIESDGNSYIRTSIVPRSVTGMKLKISSHDTSSDKFHSGARNDSGNSRFTTGTNNEGITVGYAIGLVLGDVSLRKIYSDVEYTVSINFLNDRKVLFNDTELADISLIAFPNDYTIPIGLLANNSYGTPLPHIGDRIYSVVITHGSAIIFNGIPCYLKNSESAIGLYDTVSGVFLTNSGTGTLIKGPDIVTGDELLNELEAIL